MRQPRGDRGLWIERTYYQRIDRFFSRFERVGSCWVWTGARSDGYGITRWPQLTPSGVARTHIVAFYLGTGSLPLPGQDLDHLCHNRACAELGHLDPCPFVENRVHRRFDPPEVTKFFQRLPDDFYLTL